MKPIIYLDVDGVISPDFEDDHGLHFSDSPKSESYDPWNDFINADNLGIYFNYSPTVISKIKEIIDNDLADVVWLTSWKRNANKILIGERIINLPELEVKSLDYSKLPMNQIVEHIWWKAQIVVEDYFTYQRPFIWIDDDIECYLNQGVMFYQHNELTSLVTIFDDIFEKDKNSFLIISPSYNIGIEPFHFDHIYKFLKHHEH